MSTWVSVDRMDKEKKKQGQFVNLQMCMANSQMSRGLQYPLWYSVQKQRCVTSSTSVHTIGYHKAIKLPQRIQKSKDTHYYKSYIWNFTKKQNNERKGYMKLPVFFCYDLKVRLDSNWRSNSSTTSGVQEALATSRAVSPLVLWWLRLDRGARYSTTSL